MLLYCDNIYLELDEISSPITVYMNIASDTINFKNVLQKLDLFGFDEKFLKCFPSSLVNRQHKVKTGGSHSTFSQISDGGPQGSIFAVFYTPCI